MLLIYTPKITSRFSYIMKHIFNRMLGIEVGFTSTVEDFIKHQGAKFTYAKLPLQNEFFVRSTELLFDQGINDVKIKMGDWDGTPCFFSAGDKSTIPFDIFSASFYLLSRYEEYLPHVKDIHGRFPPTESLAFQHQFLQLPVVDLWAKKFLEILVARFPSLEVRPKKYKYTSVIDVTTSHCYLYKGVIRSISGIVMDIGTLKVKRLFERLLVFMRLRKDPYDNFDRLIELHKKFKVQSHFFFQFAAYSTYDKNVSINNNTFITLIKSVADYSKVSLAASYTSFGSAAVVLSEKVNLSSVLHRPINAVRLRYNRVDVPHSYRNLVDAEFTDDFTMGYTHQMGFRAGTCTPFQFYDINLEAIQPVKVHPFAFHDYALQVFKNTREILPQIQQMLSMVKAVNGGFISVFSNELLGGEKGEEWMRLYENCLKEFHV